MGNISSVRDGLGLPTIPGYKPKAHVGKIRRRQVEELIRNRLDR
jgi:hypothetical protein